MNDHEKMASNIFNSMLTAIKRETSNGRHPHVRLQSFSPSAKLYDVRIESEQISEKLELQPSEYAAFTNLLKENGIQIEK